jgi:UDP-glucose 4-epimerase
VLQLVEAIGATPEHAPARTGEVARSCLDVGRAAALLDWSAEVPLDDGLRRTRESAGVV